MFEHERADGVSPPARDLLGGDEGARTLGLRLAKQTLTLDPVASQYTLPAVIVDRRGSMCTRYEQRTSAILQQLET
jgi:hypothetical protein